MTIHIALHKLSVLWLHICSAQILGIYWSAKCTQSHMYYVTKHFLSFVRTNSNRLNETCCSVHHSCISCMIHWNFKNGVITSFMGRIMLRELPLYRIVSISSYATACGIGFSIAYREASSL